MKKWKNILIIDCSLLIIIGIILNISNNIIKKSYAMVDNSLVNATRVYFNAEVTKSYGNGDCILLENYDANGNKIYGLIDAGRKIVKNDSNGNSSTVVKNFLNDHGVTKLDFLFITHSHGDHNGDALSVLNNFQVDTIYMKEFDANYSLSGSQSGYERIIEAAIEKNIKIIGVSYLSLNSSELSPSRSASFIEKVKNAKEDLFESFYYNSDSDNNIIFKFGSATLKIFNWEMFDTNGNQYITGVTTNATKETVQNENNNTITLLLTQGNKKAFFAGDMNNLDKNDDTGRVGDEDRLKDKIGDVDFLKLGHHGYTYSNTKDYLDTLKPEYAVITNDVGGMIPDTKQWLDEHKANYLYTTVDEKGIIATITTDRIYFGLETLNSFQRLGDGSVYYIPDTEQDLDYTNNLYEIKYKNKEVSVNNWNELKKVIDENKTDISSVNSSNKSVTIYELKVLLKAGGDYTVDKTISIAPQQKITLTTEDNIKILRGTTFKNDPIFNVEGELSIGEENMKGNITIDGNKSNVTASNVLILCFSGKLNLYKNVKISNNLYKMTSGSTYSYASGILANNSVVNMYGGEITGNDLVYEINLNYSAGEKRSDLSYPSYGSGITLRNVSEFNMYSGKISNNSNQSTVTTKTNSSYTQDKAGYLNTWIGSAGLTTINATVNLLGGEITSNVVRNNSSLTLVTPSDPNKDTFINSMDSLVYGVGAYLQASEVTIKNNFKIASNEAYINNKVELQDRTSAKGNLRTGIKGQQLYTYLSNLKIDNATISGGKYENNPTIINNNSNSSIITYTEGGGILIEKGTFDIKNLKLTDNVSDYGGGLYTINSSGKITDSILNNNEAKITGGAIYHETPNTTLELNNVEIVSNKAANKGGGIKTTGKVIVNGGSIHNNTAKTTGGGINFENGILYVNNASITNNTADTDGNDLYPADKVSVDSNGPTVSVTGNDGLWTNKNIPITITATDNETGVKSLTVDGQTLNEDVSGYIYTATNNGTFEIVATDNAGNNTNQSFSITNIDKNSPIITGASNNTTYRSDITLNANDSLSGIKTTTLLKDGKEISYKLGDKITTSGKYTLTVTDNATNSSSLTFTIDKSLKDADIVITGISNTWSNKNQTIQLTIKNDYKSVSVNGKQVSLTNGSYTLTATYNQTFTIDIVDPDGKTITKTIQVTNIDKTPPTIYGVTNGKVYTEKVNITVRDEESGFASIIVNKDGKETKYTNSNIVLTETGTYQIKAIDKVGNENIRNFKLEIPIKDENIEDNNSTDDQNINGGKDTIEDENITDTDDNDSDNDTNNQSNNSSNNSSTNDNDYNEDFKDNFEKEKKKNNNMNLLLVISISILLLGIAIICLIKLFKKKNA